MLAQIRDAKKPACGHNMLFDLVFVLNIFGGDYPTWAEFKQACELFFPAGIYDTKHIFKDVEKRAGQRLIPSNHLGEVYASMKAPEISTEADAATQTPVKELLKKAIDASGTPDGCVPHIFVPLQLRATTEVMTQSLPSVKPCTQMCASSLHHSANLELALVQQRELLDRIAKEYSFGVVRMNGRCCTTSVVQ